MAREPARPRLGRFRQPRWRDPAFLAAAAITAVVFAVQVALVRDRSGWLVWAALGLRLVVTWFVISSLIRIRVGMERGLMRGFAEAEERTRSGRPTAAESAARTGGRLAGRAVRAYRRRPR